MLWERIWNKDKDLHKNVSTLQALIFADGFDSGAGKVLEDDWMAYVERASEWMRIGKGDTLYEVGCGSGAFLYPFYAQGYDVGGMDYARPLVAIAQSTMPDKNFMLGEALSLQEKPLFDHVFSNGVFHYFQSLSYAQAVLAKMIAKARKGVAIFEIPDLARKHESEAERSRALPPGEYESKYRGLEHLYYSRDWFVDEVARLGYVAEVFDQHIANYTNSKFRFNVVIHKNV